MRKTAGIRVFGLYMHFSAGHGVILCGNYRACCWEMLIHFHQKKPQKYILSGHSPQFSQSWFGNSSFVLLCSNTNKSSMDEGTKTETVSLIILFEISS